LIPTILIAGIGNIFLGDDGFGVCVAQRLGVRKLPECVRVVDFGIRGFDLAYALMDGYDISILVDATPRGGRPGTLYTLEPDLNAVPDPATEGVEVETHGMDPMKVLALVKAMGGEFKRILVVGCEPALPGPDQEWQMELSPAVDAVVEGAVEMVESLIDQLIKADGPDFRLIDCGFGSCGEETRDVPFRKER
jgi:hydrogenase maturation protease